MIEVKHLSKSFDGKKVLSDINFTINDGEVVSIIGPSGTGKSTLLRCLNLLEKPDGGEILIGDADILSRKSDVTLLRRKMGMVFQSFNLFDNMTARENVMFGPLRILKKPREEALSIADALLSKVGMSDRADAYPDELSGGQKQRVAIARALAMEPEIMLFDEPTSALDPLMVREVLGVIRALAKSGMTMAIVTHEMSFARDVSTKVLYIDEGVVYEQGAPSVIFDAPEKEKTRLFINQTRTLEKSIENSGFDFYGFTSELDRFCDMLSVERTAQQRATLVIEELLFGLSIVEKAENAPVKLRVEYSEKKSELSIILFCSTDPLQDDNNDISAKLIRGMTEKAEWNGDSLVIIPKK